MNTPFLLREKIEREIRAQGRISFARFMEIALYTPGLGYYTAGRQKFGRTGDFITGPEFSAEYSFCIARQCQQVLESESGDILEFGAGTGILAARILIYLSSVDQLPNRYYILEVSSDLQARQRETLQKHVPHLLSKVKWLSTLNDMELKGVIIANEVLDAFPVNRFKFIKGQLREFYVCSNEEREFIFTLDTPSAELAAYVENIKLPYREGYQSECNLFLKGWIKAVSHILISGVCLLIDYGFPREEYYHPDRDRGTLMCHFQHRAHSNPLINIGMQDITAHIDFTAVAEAATQSGLMVSGFTSQASFLVGCGLMERLESCPQPEYADRVNEIKVLTSPHEMGEMFKVMALTKDFDEGLLGFSWRDYCEKVLEIDNV